MTLTLYLLFGIPVFLLLHSYVFYPLIMRFRAKGKTSNDLIFHSEESLPYVAVLMAVYNEEVILEKKIASLLTQGYPKDRIHVYIGSDNSTDSTNQILQAAHSSNFTPILFDSRQGKPNIINQLSVMASQAFPDGEGLFLMTDASVILENNVVSQLARHFKNSEIGMVDAHMTYTGMKAEGISRSENSYLSSEVRLKSYESKVSGQMIGPFGGCFMMRANLFKPVPTNFLVDDFYISMTLLSDGHKVINELSALCFEPVSHDAEEEFRRKKRISAGNFQNLVHFRHILNPFTPLGFYYISHKVIRWIGPILMIVIGLSSLLLAWHNGGIWIVIVIGQLLWYGLVPLLDKLLQSMKVQYSLIRNIRYFNKMNFALLSGLVKYIGGIHTNIWQPTKRE